MTRQPALMLRVNLPHKRAIRGCAARRRLSKFDRRPTFETNPLSGFGGIRIGPEAVARRSFSDAAENESPYATGSEFVIAGQPRSQQKSAFLIRLIPLSARQALRPRLLSERRRCTRDFPGSGIRELAARGAVGAYPTTWMTLGWPTIRTVPSVHRKVLSTKVPIASAPRSLP